MSNLEENPAVTLQQPYLTRRSFYKQRVSRVHSRTDTSIMILNMDESTDKTEL